MIKTSVLRYAAIGMATMSLAGFAAASTVSFDTTGADSNQQVELNNSHNFDSSNYNSVGVGSFNAQDANSGHVSADQNTSVGGNGSGNGSVGSGDASNQNDAHTDLSVNNSGSGMGAFSNMGAGNNSPDVRIHLTGASSNNTVESNNNDSVKMTNENNVQVSNLNLQSAQSGNVSANKNTTVGGLMSGSAHNSSNSTTSVSVHN